MHVRVLLFGGEALAAGSDAVTVSVDSPTCASVREALATAHPALRPQLGSARFAVNSEFAAPDQPIQPGDEVALIGLVSGG